MKFSSATILPLTRTTQSIPRRKSMKKSSVSSMKHMKMRILTEHDSVLESVAKALLLVETIDGQQFEDLYTGRITAEDLRESVEKADEEKKAKDEKEAKEREELRQEEERRLMEELKKYDSDYLGEDEAPEAGEPHPQEEEDKDESNS